MEIRVGTAGWAIPAPVRGQFDGEGTLLQKYGTRFSCAEINSTFYRPHRASTFGRWADSVAENFRFALKVPKEITHTRRLVGVEAELDAFLEQTSILGAKRGALLVQLPPSFAYDSRIASAFFTLVRARYDGLLVCEPRHATWFEGSADAVLRDLHVARAAADPPVVPEAAEPGGWDGVTYYRLHGSPRVYWSAYDDTTLAAMAARMRAGSKPVWCIFDNTAAGAGAANALALTELLH